eukprot:jgi/Chrpa1/13274/Chrysochromulina_OHIO_Genome00004658-RA
MPQNSLPRNGGGISGFERSFSSPTLGPLRGPGTGSCSIRLPLGALPDGAAKHYDVPPAEKYRPASRGGCGTKFGPKFGSPVRNRFPEPHTYTAKAFMLTPLPPPWAYKEPRQPGWRYEPSRSSSRLSFRPVTSHTGRSSPVQWTPGHLDNVLQRGAYKVDDTLDPDFGTRSFFSSDSRPGSPVTIVNSRSSMNSRSSSRVGSPAALMFNSNSQTNTSPSLIMD